MKPYDEEILLWREDEAWRNKELLCQSTMTLRRGKTPIHGVDALVYFKNRWPLVYQIPIIRKGNLEGMHYFFEVNKNPHGLNGSAKID